MADKETGRGRGASESRRSDAASSPAETQEPRYAGVSCVPTPPVPALALPLHYGRDHLAAIVRDPNCVFVYWEQQGPRMEEVRREYGKDIFDGACWILRIHSNISDEPQDVPVIPEGCNWYLHVPENGTYVVEIGIVSRKGQFISMSKSNPVATPRKSPSDDGNCEWMLVEGDFQRVVRLTNGKPPLLVGEFASATETFRAPIGSSFVPGRFHGSGSR